MKQLLSRLFGPKAPQLVAEVEVRFVADLTADHKLQVAVVNPDGSIAAMSSISGIAAWLSFHGFTYAIGSTGKWVRIAC